VGRKKGEGSAAWAWYLCATFSPTYTSTHPTQNANAPGQAAACPAQHLAAAALPAGLADAVMLRTWPSRVQWGPLQPGQGELPCVVQCSSGAAARMQRRCANPGGRAPSNTVSMTGAGAHDISRYYMLSFVAVRGRVLPGCVQFRCMLSVLHKAAQLMNVFDWRCIRR